MYGALDVRLFPNECLNVDLKNIEIWVLHGLNDRIYCRKLVVVRALLRIPRFINFVVA